jgi:carbonic anhydrase
MALLLKNSFEHLAKGNSLRLFITCPIPRILPHLITQADPAFFAKCGNIVPPGADEGRRQPQSNLRFLLGVKDIIVCNIHRVRPPCYGQKVVEAAIVRNGFIDPTRKLIRENYANLADEQLLSVAIQENVLSQLENVKTHPSVSAAISRGELGLQGWVYKIESGEVFAYHGEKGQFLPFTEIHALSGCCLLCQRQ